MKFAVTTGQNSSPSVHFLAKKWADFLKVEFIFRKKGTLDDLLKEYSLSAVIVATAIGVRLYSIEGTLFFHPSLSTLRIKNIIAGKPDRLINAMQLAKGMTVLDCTLGLASDACVASYVVGKSGKVVGLEAIKPIAFVIEQGLACYKANDDELEDVYNNIEVIQVEALKYLVSQPDKSFDIVYFDPMFDNAVKGSSNMKPLRFISYKKTLDLYTIKQALRVARRRVVIKLHKYDKLPTGFDIELTNDGKYSKVKYGVIEV